MRVFIIPIWIMIVLIALAWIGVVYLYWFKPKVMPKLDDYFAQRRHDRRTRNYVKQEIAMTRKLYDLPTTRKGGIPYAPARHRR